MLSREQKYQRKIWERVAEIRRMECIDGRQMGQESRVRILLVAVRHFGAYSKL
jgi:hypothetical protein